MRGEAIGIILAILVASLGVGYLAGNSGSHAKTLTSTSTVTDYVAAKNSTKSSLSTSSPPASNPQPCSSAIPEDPLASPADVSGSGVYNAHVLANGTYRWLVFTMRPGGIATFCINILLRQANVTANELAAAALVVNATSVPGAGCCEYSYAQAKNINITSNPSSLNMTSLRNGFGYVSELHTITTGRSATGFYSLSYPGVCGLIPLAVTNGPQRVSASDFVGFFVPSTCPLFPPFAGWTQMTGFSGMTAAWVNGIPGEAP